MNQLIRAVFNWNYASPIIFNKSLYFGAKNFNIICNSFACDAVERITTSLNQQNVSSSKRIIKTLLNNLKTKAVSQDIEKEQILEIKI